MTFPIDDISKIAESLGDTFRHVNSGGCGVVAAMLAKELRKYTSVDVVVCNNYGARSITDLRKACSNIEEWYSSGFSVTHMWVEFEFLGERLAIDSTGIHPAAYLYDDWGDTLDGALTEKETDELLAADHWNPMFDRKQIPDMEQYVSDNFAGVAA